MLKQWVETRGDSDHLPIFAKILRNPANLASPFKFCKASLKNEEVTRLI